MADTAVHSFIVRFVQEEPTAEAWRGFIRHVQSNEETHFTHIQDAIRFMGQYVKVNPGEENKKDFSV